MSSKTIYTPYTYLIKFIPTNQVYYGVRYAKNCHPSDLFVTYFTSSTEICRLIQQHGLESFIISIRKTFNSAEKARNWESKVLKRIKAAQHSRFINKSNGSAPSSDKEIRDIILKTFILKYGVDNPSKHPLIVQKIIDFWSSLSVEEKETINNKRDNTCLSRYGETNVMKISKIKDKGKQTNIQRYGVEYAGKQSVVCPWCKKTGGKMGFDVFHFNYCKDNPHRIVRNLPIYACTYCDVKSSNKSNMDRYHFENCKLSPNYKPKKSVIYKCPHCNVVKTICYDTILIIVKQIKRGHKVPFLLSVSSLC